jgi:hypothetical protein
MTPIEGPAPPAADSVCEPATPLFRERKVGPGVPQRNSSIAYMPSLLAVP